MKLKATLILLGILAVVTAVVFMLTYNLGSRNQNAKTTRSVPSEQAANAYVVEQKLLASVKQNEFITVAGPTFRMVSGFAADGKAVTVWLTGKDNSIELIASAKTEDGISRDEMVAKLGKAGIASDKIEKLFVAPYDYSSGKLVWLLEEKGPRRHVVWYDFKTGEQIRDGYLDPTGWSMEAK